MKKKLAINCALCNLSQVSQEVLNEYESILINAATVITSPRSRALMARLPVKINAASTVDVPDGAELSQHNGSFEIKPGPPPEPPVVLVVNGRLVIHPGAREALQGYPSISVNGEALYPQGLSDALGRMKVNGASYAYPDEAILLKKNAVIDRVFVLRAKEGLYFSPRSIIMTDPELDVKALTDKGAHLQASRVYIANALLEAVLPLINDDAQVHVIPDGFAFLQGDQTLSEQLLRSQGHSLYILGDLHIPQDAAQALEQLEGLQVCGQISLP